MHPRLLLSTCILLAVLGTFPVPRASAASPTPASPGYAPPAFPDSHADRVARVRALGGEISELYRAHAVARHFPAVAFGVVVDDELVVAGAHGFTDVARQVPATPRSVFRIASMTKSFTAMAVLQLRDAGKLDLDRPLRRDLPELRRLRLLTADSPALTPRHLLTHGAGFPEDNPWGDRQLADSQADLVRLVEGPLRFSNAPDVAYEYSNLGFALLGRLVHRVSGKTCQDYITARILQPLGMHATAWDYSRVPPDLLAHGYRWMDGQWREEALLGDGSFAPMGGLMSSVEDFTRYIAFQLSAWPPRDDADPGPLCRASRREMQHPWRMNALNPRARAADGSPCPNVSAYGYGLRWAQDCQGRETVGHTGGLPGFGSQWRILPAHGVGFVGFANVTYAGFGPVHDQLIDLLTRKAGLGPRQLPASGILRRQAEALVKLLPDWSRAETSGLFADNFFADYALASLQDEARELFRKTGIGPAPRIEAIQPENQLRGKVLLAGQQGRLEIFLTLTPENPPRIQEYHLRLLPPNTPAP